MMRDLTTIKTLFLLLIACTLIAIYAGIKYSYVKDALLPIQQSVYPWEPYAVADATVDGASSIELEDSVSNLIFHFNLSTKAKFPYAIMALRFGNDEHPARLLDWSKYSFLTLRIKCSPNNVLDFTLRTYDSQVTVNTDIRTYRPSAAFFNCGEKWQKVQINLRQLETQEWWILTHKLNLSDRNYALDKVGDFYLSNSRQSPTGILSSVVVEEIILEGRNWHLVYSIIILTILIWIVFFYWCRPRLTSLRKNPQSTPSLMAVTYQQLATESKHDRDKSALFDYLKSNYSNPSLSADIVVSELGINRSKMNDILREETGLTFSAYLNKLRLTEAARLMSEKHMGVAEAAYAVGYGSISNFNRVFKKEYGFAPSNYKKPTAVHPTVNSDSENSHK